MYENIEDLFGRASYGEITEGFNGKVNLDYKD